MPAFIAPVRLVACSAFFRFPRPNIPINTDATRNLTIIIWKGFILSSAISLATNPPPHMTVTSISPPIASHFFITHPPVLLNYILNSILYSLQLIHFNFHRFSGKAFYLCLIFSIHCDFKPCASIMQTEG